MSVEQRHYCQLLLLAVLLILLFSAGTMFAEVKTPVKTTTMHLPSTLTDQDDSTAVRPSLRLTVVERKWLHQDESPGIDRQKVLHYLFLLVAGSILFAGTLIIWNLLLKRQVKRKTVQLKNQLIEHQKIEKMLKENETYFRAIFNAANDAVFIHDIETGAILDVNYKACEMFGRSWEEMLQTDVGTLSSGVPPYIQEEMVALIQKAANKGPQLFEWQAKDKSGSLFWNEVYMCKAPIGEEDRVIATTRDISERKQTEEKLLLSEQRLREAQSIVHLGSWELDVTNNRIIWSDEAYRIFGFEPQVFDVTYEDFLGRIHPEDREAVDRAYRESLGKRIGYRIEHRLLLPDGTIKYVCERCVTEYDEWGKPRCSIGTVLDITERKMVEIEIQQLNFELEKRVVQRTAELAEKNRELERFNKLMVDRELRMIELKKEIDRLRKEAASLKK